MSMEIEKNGGAIPRLLDEIVLTFLEVELKGQADKKDRENAAQMGCRCKYFNGWGDDVFYGSKAHQGRMTGIHVHCKKHKRQMNLATCRTCSENKQITELCKKGTDAQIRISF